MLIEYNESLGWREAYRLGQFIEKMLLEHHQDTIDCKMGYSLEYDEPYIVVTNNYPIQRFYASDYDYAFKSNNEICNI